MPNAAAGPSASTSVTTMDPPRGTLVQTQNTPPSQNGCAVEGVMHRPKVTRVGCQAPAIFYELWFSQRRATWIRRLIFLYANNIPRLWAY
jgi:hypothetical protein